MGWWPCSSCCGDVPPPPNVDCCMQVTFSSNTCIGNVTFVLELTSEIPPTWSCDVSNHCLGLVAKPLIVTLTDIGGGDWRIRVTLDGNTWDRIYTLEPDMCTLSAENIPFISGTCSAVVALTAIDTDDPSCPSCGVGGCDFTTCSGSATIHAIDVDLGAGGWTDLTCEICGISGPVLLAFHNFFTTCYWRFDDDSCDVPLPAIKLRVEVFFEEITSSTVKMVCRVLIIDQASILRDLVVYKSAEFSKCDTCFPRTLTKDGSDFHDPTFALCEGLMPGTITITEA